MPKTVSPLKREPRPFQVGIMERDLVYVPTQSLYGLVERYDPYRHPNAPTLEHIVPDRYLLDSRILGIGF